VKHEQFTMEAARPAWPGQATRARSVEFARFAQGQLLADAWERLERHATLPTQSLGFATALSHSMLADTPIAVFVGRGDGALRALIPLCRGAGYFARWRLAGASEVFEPGDALCDGPDGARLLARVIAADRRAVSLARLPAGTLMVPAMRAAMRGRGFVSVRPAMASPIITLGPRWQTPETCFNAGRRSDFRRAQRRAARMGQVFYEVIAPEPLEFDALFDEAIAVEVKSWKCESGSAMARDPDKEALFRAWLRHACAQGTLRIAFMRIGQRAVAMQMAVIHADRFWLLKIGYDEAYGPCSPGSLLMLHTLGHAAQEGLAAYELLGGMEPWIAGLWTQDSHDCVSLRTYPFTLRGGVALMVDAAQWFRERVMRRAR
jgi:CelD/BcsL family acetyltransferase involved in cellulose biosynthesis